MTNKLALIVAVTLGVLSILGIKLYVDKVKGEVERSQRFTEVLVAARDIRAGETIDAKDIDRLKLPSPAIEALKKTIIESQDNIAGQKIMQEVKQGQILQSYHFGAKGRARVPLAIGQEFRAITIPVTGVTGVAGLVRPGDWVDVIGVFEFKSATGGGSLHLARFVAKRVLVLATDAFTDPHAEQPLVDYTTVTLRLKPGECTRIALAVGTQQHIQLARMDENAVEAPGWDAVTPDKIFKEVEDEVKK